MSYSDFQTQTARLRGRGISVTRLAETGEYRVNFIGGAESTAYYTDDRSDAIATGDALASDASEASMRYRFRALVPAFDAR